MNRDLIRRNASVLLTVAMLWAWTGAIGAFVYTDLGAPNVAHAANPCNPRNPCQPKGEANPCNPCNPCQPKGKANPCNPCNPCQPKAEANPCNPCQPKGKANPCNPCNPCQPKAEANPCNPGNAKPQANPCNPCNPCNAAGGAKTTGAVLKTGADYYLSGKYEKTTGFVPSASHGNRFVVTFVSPSAAAKIYRNNAAKVRAGQTTGMTAFPVGTTIVKESYVKQSDGTPGKRGPIFVMQKRRPEYDASGNDWQYSMAQADLQLIGEGTTGPVAFCKACHLTMQNQDFVFARDH